MSRRTGLRVAAAVPTAPARVSMPVQGTPAAARIADVLRVGHALARHRSAAVGGCIIVDNTVYCFTDLEVMQWWVLLEEVLPDAPSHSTHATHATMNDYLKGKHVNDETAAVAAAFYRDYLQGGYLGLPSRSVTEFKNFETGMEIFREALTALEDAKAKNDETSEKAAYKPTAKPAGG